MFAKIHYGVWGHEEIFFQEDSPGQGTMQNIAGNNLKNLIYKVVRPVQERYLRDDVECGYLFGKTLDKVRLNSFPKLEALLECSL